MSVGTAVESAPFTLIVEGGPTLRQIAMRYIPVVLDKHAGDKPAAARELGISLKTLYTKLHQIEEGGEA